MVLAEYKPTRSQLLQLRRRRRTAERGHRLLKLNRAAVIVEFVRVLERARTLRSNLAEKYRISEQRIAIARAIEGSIGVESAALASKEVPTLQLKTKNVMGIIVPKIDAKSVRKKLEDRGYGIITTSARIDEAAEAYEALVEDIVVAAGTAWGGLSGKPPRARGSGGRGAVPQDLRQSPRRYRPRPANCTIISRSPGRSST